MEKDEIKALINREVTKQGRNIMGGGLSNILNAILDAIPEGGGNVIEVEGTAGTDADNNWKFIPESGSPSYDELKAAFEAGSTIFFKGFNSAYGTPFVAKVVSLSGDSASYGAGLGAIIIYPDNGECRNIPIVLFED